jgi:hypothetical protein
MLVGLPGMILFISICQSEANVIKAVNIFQQQEEIKLDSIDQRLKFLHDSVLTREQFVKDSILRRKQILDSLTFLQGELQYLLEAILRTTKEDIISHADKIAIIGDSVLSDYVYHKLLLALSGAYAPWKGRLSLNAKSFIFTFDKKTRKISKIQSPSMKCTLTYASQGNVLIIQESDIIQNSSSGNFLKIPVDSVFYDQNKKIVKIKQYENLYELVNTYQKGKFLFTNLTLVKQYQYDAGNQITNYEQVRFCDRYKVYEPRKVCSITKYSFTKQNNNYLITRRNDPASASDGNFTLEYDENENIKCISFRDLSNNLVWQRLVELNKEGNISCYIEKTHGIKSITTCMVYNNEPNAKYPLEIIYTTFDDGIDYYQKNLTTGKTRLRNKMTLEWDSWK